MTDFLDQLNQWTMVSDVILSHAIVSIILSFILAVVITLVYKWTHRGDRYSQSFVHTIIIMSVVVSVVMIVIGNNIAVAFGLVGAFSIIRFRTAMSDPKDIAFIFFGMASGIACGLGFFVLAVVFTVCVSVFIIILTLLDFGHKPQTNRVLKITIPENMHYENVFDDIFAEHLAFIHLNSIETTNLGTMMLLEYSIKMKENVVDKALIDAIREHNANLKVSIQMPTSRVIY